MERDYYIFKSGRIKRKGNTVYIEGTNFKKAIPVEQIFSIYAFGELDLNTKLITFLAQKGILVHFFNYYGFYSGTFTPRKRLLSGNLLVKQVQHYLDQEKRLVLAKEFVSSAIANILKNLGHYERQGKEVGEKTEAIRSNLALLPQAASIQELMGIEGRTRDTYYSSFETFLREGFGLKKRVKRPPNNMMNCLVSFGNSLLYTTVLSEIYHTQLDPTISYLHEPGERRYSLSLDISETFKPFLVDRVIFNLVNNRIVNKKDFQKDLNFCYLNESGRKKFVTEYDAKLQTTIKHRTLGRNVSYKHLIRLDCYKLIKHLLGEKPFEAFRIWW